MQSEHSIPTSVLCMHTDVPQPDPPLAATSPKNPKSLQLQSAIFPQYRDGERVVRVPCILKKSFN